MQSLGSLKLQAAGGDPRAQLALARLMIGGQVAGEPSEIMNLVQAACAQNFADGYLLHAVLAATGIVRTKKLDDAYAYLQRAAALGHQGAAAQLDVLGRETFDRTPWFEPIHLNTVADAPRICTIDAFLPKYACDWITKIAYPALEPATVFDYETGKGVRDPRRTNAIATFSLLKPDLILLLACRRIASAVGLPITHQEPTTVLRYAPGEQYFPHFDFIAPQGGFAADVAAHGQRSATLLVYLNEGYEGGETEFPRLGFRYKGKTGDALLFWNVAEDGRPERDSLHAGLPVREGEKWLLSKWIRERPMAL